MLFHISQNESGWKTFFICFVEKENEKEKQNMWKCKLILQNMFPE